MASFVITPRALRANEEVLEIETGVVLALVLYINLLSSTANYNTNANMFRSGRFFNRNQP